MHRILGVSARKCQRATIGLEKCRVHLQVQWDVCIYNYTHRIHLHKKSPSNTLHTRGKTIKHLKRSGVLSFLYLYCGAEHKPVIWCISIRTPEKAIHLNYRPHSLRVLTQQPRSYSWKMRPASILSLIRIIGVFSLLLRT
jgi:hypothetical protein